MYTTRDEKDPNGKLQGGRKLKPKPKLKAREKDKNKIRGTLLAKQEISLVNAWQCF
jgi:hypothetical protein